MGSTQSREHMGRHRLHAKRQPSHAGIVVRPQLGHVDGFGIALDGHLGPRL